MKNNTTPVAIEMLIFLFIFMVSFLVYTSLSKDTYKPMNRIVEVGTKTVVAPPSTTTQTNSVPATTTPTPPANTATQTTPVTSTTTINTTNTNV